MSKLKSHKMFLKTIWELKRWREKDWESFFQDSSLIFHQRRPRTICSTKICKRKKDWRLLLFLIQVTSYRKNGRRLSERKRRWASTVTFTMYKNNDVKRICRDTKNIILIKWRLLACAKDAISQEQRQVQGQRWRTEQKLLEACKKFSEVTSQ